MDKIIGAFCGHVQSRRAQILLPAVMLAPIFILVVYLLFETAKLSMTKVRQQFALDNSAYSQMSTASTYLNTVAMINGPSVYRVMKSMNQPLKVKPAAKNEGVRTVFDMFYAAGAFPALGPSHEIGSDGAISNPIPSPESTDWDVRYYGDKRKNWMKEDPKDSFDGKDKNGKDTYNLTDKALTDTYFFSYEPNNDNNLAIASVRDYFTIFVRTGSIYAAQTYIYNDTVRNSRMFRQAYFLNTRDCKQSECGRQAATTLERYVLETKPMEIDDTNFYISVVDGNTHMGAQEIPLKMTEIVQSKLFQFAYLTGGSRSKLKQMSHGILLKQKYRVPANRFNINLEQRYKPEVRNTIYLSCPRSGNNCVWPNPLPKYSVRVGV